MLNPEMQDFWLAHREFLPLSDLSSNQRTWRAVLNKKCLSTPAARTAIGYSAWRGRTNSPAAVQASAITSISTATSFGNRATSTVERAGGAFLQIFP